jgi:hypothetical protein
MHLDYRLSEDWDENSTDLAAADETSLRYYAVTGDIIFRDDQTDLSARWGWIPLIDFALAMREICQALEVTGQPQTFEFTESDATLHFERRGQEMTIRGSYTTGVIIVPFTTFRGMAGDFARRLDAEVLAKRPELRLNRVYQGFKLSGLSD